MVRSNTLSNIKAMIYEEYILSKIIMTLDYSISKKFDLLSKNCLNLITLLKTKHNFEST